VSLWTRGCGARVKGGAGCRGPRGLRAGSVGAWEGNRLWSGWREPLDVGATGAMGSRLRVGSGRARSKRKASPSVVVCSADIGRLLSGSITTVDMANGANVSGLVVCIISYSIHHKL
jgi:hypothetical protein